MLLDRELLNHRAEVARLLRGRKYDVTPTGIRLGRMNADINGVFETEHRRRVASGFVSDGRQIHHNLLTTEGRNHAVDVILGHTAATATWYCALFEGNVSPAAGWTAGNFDSNATEFTDYDEATRVAFDEGAAASGSADNASNRAVFTIASGVTNKSLYGGALLSASAKEATTGVLLAASSFSSVRIVNATDELLVKYTLSLTSS